MKTIRRHSGWIGGAALILVMAGLFLAVGGVAQASGLMDGGGFPSATPTATVVPSATATLTPPPILYPYPVETPTLALLQPDQDFLPSVEEKAAPTTDAQTSPSLGTLCLPFGVALLLVVVILASWLQRRGQRS